MGPRGNFFSPGPPQGEFNYPKGPHAGGIYIINIKLPIKSRVSLFPFKEIKAVEAVGLKYPVENLKFSPMGRIGTSNISTSENIRISYQGSGMLGIFSSRHLDIFYNWM